MSVRKVLKQINVGEIQPDETVEAVKNQLYWLKNLVACHQIITYDTTTIISHINDLYFLFIQLDHPTTVKSNGCYVQNCRGESPTATRSLHSLINISLLQVIITSLSNKITIEKNHPIIVLEYTNFNVKH